MLCVIETHPIQYHAPVYRVLQTEFGIPVTAIYGADFSVVGYRDHEFRTDLAWDTDLLSGYSQLFLSRVSVGGACAFEDVSARGLKNALRKVAPKAALIAGYSHRFNQAAIYEAWRARYPIIFRGETTDHARSRNSFKAGMRDVFLRWLYRHSARLLYIGRHSYEHYKRLNCPDDKLIFSPYCVDVSSFELGAPAPAPAMMRQKTRQNLGLHEEWMALLFSGKLSHRKGPDLILHAIKLLPPNVREKIAVIFLGAGQLRDELERLARESPQVKAFFPGFQNQTQLSRFYYAADLLILPSRENETWGLVVNEALHHGLPCVVSEAVGCAPDFIEDGVTGMVFETNSSQSLASALQAAFKLIGRDDARRICKQRVNDYSVVNAARGIAEAYWAVCST